MPPQKWAAAKKSCFRGRRNVFYRDDGRGTLLLTGDGTMKTAGLIGVIAVCALVACQKADTPHEPIFTLVKNERYIYAYGSRGDGTIGNLFAYGETILIDSMPKNFVKKHRDELKRLMIYHYFRLTSTIDSLKISADLDYATCNFVRSTPETREYYITGVKYASEFGRNGRVNPKTYVGTLYMGYCEYNGVSTGRFFIKAKRYVEISVNVGKAAPDWYYGDLEGDILQDDCNPEWYESNKDNDLVKYYMELRNK